MEIKEHQPSMDIDEQIDNLKAIGLIIGNEDYARQTSMIYHISVLSRLMDLV